MRRLKILLVFEILRISPLISESVLGNTRVIMAILQKRLGIWPPAPPSESTSGFSYNWNRFGFNPPLDFYIIVIELDFYIIGIELDFYIIGIIY